MSRLNDAELDKFLNSVAPKQKPSKKLSDEELDSFLNSVSGSNPQEPLANETASIVPASTMPISNLPSTPALDALAATQTQPIDMSPRTKIQEQVANNDPAWFKAFLDFLQEGVSQSMREQDIRDAAQLGGASTVLENVSAGAVDLNKGTLGVPIVQNIFPKTRVGLGQNTADVLKTYNIPEEATAMINSPGFQTPLAFEGATLPIGMVSRGLSAGTQMAGRTIKGLTVGTQLGRVGEAATELPTLLQKAGKLGGRLLHAGTVGGIWGITQAEDPTDIPKSAGENAFGGMILQGAGEVAGAGINGLKIKALKNISSSLAEWAYGDGRFKTLEEAQSAAGQTMENFVKNSGGVENVEIGELNKLNKVIKSAKGKTTISEPTNVTPDSVSSEMQRLHEDVMAERPQVNVEPRPKVPGKSEAAINTMAKTLQERQANLKAQKAVEGQEVSEGTNISEKGQTIQDTSAPQSVELAKVESGLKENNGIAIGDEIKHVVSGKQGKVEQVTPNGFYLGDGTFVSLNKAQKVSDNNVSETKRGWVNGDEGMPTPSQYKRNHVLLKKEVDNLKEKLGTLRKNKATKSVLFETKKELNHAIVTLQRFEDKYAKVTYKIEEKSGDSYQEFISKAKEGLIKAGYTPGDILTYKGKNGEGDAYKIVDIDQEKGRINKIAGTYTNGVFTPNGNKRYNGWEDAHLVPTFYETWEKAGHETSGIVPKKIRVSANGSLDKIKFTDESIDDYYIDRYPRAHPSGSGLIELVRIDGTGTAWLSNEGDTKVTIEHLISNNPNLKKPVKEVKPAPEGWTPGENKEFDEEFKRKVEAIHQKIHPNGETTTLKQRQEQVKNVVEPLPSNPAEVKPEHFRSYYQTIGKAIDNIKVKISSNEFPKGERIQNKIRELVDKELGRKATEDEVTDIVESAVQQHIAETIRKEGIVSITDKVNRARELEKDLLPNFARSIEKTNRQQFSTPAALAQIVHEVAGIRTSDNVLESSAGTGSLLEAITSKPNITAVELEPRRAAILKARGHNVLNQDTFTYMPKEKVDVIIMNPPFRGAARMTDVERAGSPPWKGGWGDLGNRFIALDLRRLKDGGRLISVVSPGVVDPTNKVNIPFRNWLEKNHTVIAEIVLPPDVYDTRGTHFGAGLLVVEKGHNSNVKPVIAQPKTWDELLNVLKEVKGREVVSSGSQSAKTVEGTGTASSSGGSSQAGVETTAKGVSGGRDSNMVSSRPTTTGSAKPGGNISSTRTSGKESVPTDNVSRPGEVQGELQGGSGDVKPRSGERIQPHAPVSSETSRPGERTTAPANSFSEDGQDVSTVKFVEYIPPKVSGRKSPGKVVEPPTLALVQAPDYLKLDPSLKPHPKIMEAGPEGYGLSDIQLEVDMAAKYNHRKGRGILIGDDVGVGKTGSILGVIADGYYSGDFDRQVIIANGESWIVDEFTEDNKKFGVNLPFTNVHNNEIFSPSDNAYAGKESDNVVVNGVVRKTKQPPIFDFAKHTPREGWRPFPEKDGVLVMTREDLCKYSYAVYKWLKGSKTNSRIVVDEAHGFINVPDESARDNGSNRAAILRNLWRDLKPDKGTQFVYATATSGESLDDIEYLYDLGLWDTSNFGANSFEAWKQSLMGNTYTGQGKPGRWGRPGKNDPYARAVPLTLMEQIVRELKSEGQYFGRQQALEGVEIEAIPVELTSKQIGEINSAVDFVGKISDKIGNYGGSRFSVIGGILSYMRRISGNYRLQTAIVNAKKQLAEAQRQGKKIRIVFSVDNFHASPSRSPIIENLIDKVPTAQRTDEGDMIEIPEAKFDKEELRAILDNQNPEYPNPLPELPDMIEEIQKAFGKDKVALITGEVSTRGRSEAKRQFRETLKPIIVISRAGSTGINLQDVTGDRVYFYHVDYDYDAKTFKQREGRVNRMGQKTAPKLFYPYINTGIDTRFIGTIMARMEQMGAIARGKANKVSNEELQQFNVTGAAAQLATVRALARLDDIQRETMIGVRNSEGEEFEKKTARLTAKDFMNRLMLLPFDESVQARDIFLEELAKVREDVELIGGIIDQFTTYHGDVISESSAGEGLRLLRIKTNDPGIIKKAESDFSAATLKLSNAKQAYQEAVEEIKPKIAKKLAKAEETYLKLAEETNSVLGQLRELSYNDPKYDELRQKHQELVSKRNEADNIRNHLKPLHNESEEDFLLKFSDVSRAKRRVDEAQRKYDSAKHNLDYSKEAVLIDGKVAINGLLVDVRQAIGIAARNKNIPAEAQKMEFRGYLLKDGSRVVGPVIPEYAEEEVAKALGAQLKARAVSKDDAWNALTEKKQTLRLTGGLSLEWSDYQKGVVIKGISSTDPVIKEWYTKEARPEVEFNPVSRVFVFRNEAGLKKVLTKWPLAGPIDTVSEEIDQAIAESGQGFLQADATKIATGMSDTIDRVKRAIDVLFGKDDNQVHVSDAAVERVLNATKSPLNIKAQVKESIQGVSTALRDLFVYEWTVKDFPGFQNDLRLFKGVSRDAQKFALDMTLKILRPLQTAREFELFRRLVFLRDLEEGVKSAEPDATGVAKNIGLTEEQIKAAQKELWILASKIKGSDTRIKMALWAHDKVFKAMWDDLKIRGKVSPDAENRVHYVPHRVLDYMNDVDRRFPSLSKRLKTPYRYYLKGRTGSQRLIDTDYVGITLRHLAKLYMDNATDDFNIRIATKFDQNRKLTRGEKIKLYGKTKVPVPGKLYEYNGKRYIGWQYDPGRQMYPVEIITEDTAKKVIAVGRYKKTYLLPMEIADRLTHFKDSELSSHVLNALRKANSVYKQMLFSPVTLGIPFQMNNFVGDIINLYASDAEALKYLAKGWKAAKQWQKNQVDRDLEELVRLAEQSRVMESTFMREAGMPYDPKLAKLQPRRYLLRKMNPFAKWSDISERRELAPRLAKMYADMERIDRGEIPRSNVIDVKTLIQSGMSTAEIAGKLAREVTIDYHKMNGETQRVMRDLLFPMLAFYYGNFPNWFKYAKRSPLNLAVKILLPMLILTMWNWMKFREIEEKLPDYYRVMPHIITGWKDNEGKPIIIAMQTPFDMAAKMIGLDIVPDVARRISNKEISWDEGIKEVGISMGFSPWQDFKSQLSTIIKAPIEASMNKSWFNGRKIVPERLIGTKHDIPTRLRYIVNQWVSPVGTWSRNQEENILEGAKKYVTRGPADVPRAFGVRHVDIDREQLNRFYDRLSELQAKRKEWKEALSQGKKVPFREEGKYKIYSKVARTFTDINKLIDTIEQSKRPQAIKDKAVKQIRQKMYIMAERVLKAAQ